MMLVNPAAFVTRLFLGAPAAVAPSQPRARRTGLFPPALAAILLLVAAPAGRALTLDELRNIPNLTPELFMGYFRDFQFKQGDKPQAHAAFLEGRCGDCEDFATLAADVLREKNYTPHLIAVFMDGQTHVVCYIDEVKAYLDFNRRAKSPALQPSDGSLEDIAAGVAAYFRVPWRSASEFIYVSGERRFGRIAFH